MYAINISNITAFFNRLQRMLTISENKYITDEVKNAVNFKCKIEKEDYDLQYNNSYKNSPFYRKGMKLYANVLKKRTKR